MFIISFFKILFLVVLFFMVYNIIRFMLFVKKNSAGHDGHINAGANDRKGKTSGKSGKANVIELDEDQYKVE